MGLGGVGRGREGVRRRSRGLGGGGGEWMEGWQRWRGKGGREGEHNTQSIIDFVK